MPTLISEPSQMDFLAIRIRRLKKQQQERTLDHIINKKKKQIRRILRKNAKQVLGN